MTDTVTRLRAAVEALPAGPTRDRFAALLATLRGDTPAPATGPGRGSAAGAPKQPRTVRIPAVVAAYEPAVAVGHHRRRWRRS